MNIKNLINTSLILGGLSITSHAATIAWTTADITDVNDVSNIGSTVTAISNSGGGVNGNTFVANGVTFTQDSTFLPGNFNGDVSGLTPTGDSGYDALIGTIDFDGGATNSLLQINLDVVLGTSYVVQVWYADNNTTGRVNTLTGTGDNVLQGNDYATGTFVADGATQILEITTSGGSSNNGTRLTGFQLRAVPEPSSVTLLGLGALGLLVRRRR